MATKGMTVFMAEGEDYSINDANSAAEFLTTGVYEIDDFVTYQGGYYRFVKHHAAGAWNSADVCAVDFAGEFRNNRKLYIQDTTNIRNEMSGESSVPFDLEFEQGNLNSSGLETLEWNRVRSPEFIYIGQYKKLTISTSGIQYRYNYYNASLVYTGESNFDAQTKSVTPNSDRQYVRLVCKKSNNDIIVPIEAKGALTGKLYMNGASVNGATGAAYTRNNQPFNLTISKAVDSTTGEVIAAQDTRACSEMKYARKGDRIITSAAENFQFYVAMYDLDYTFISSGSFEKYYAFTQDCHFRIVVKMTDGSSITTTLRDKFEAESWYVKNPVNHYNTGDRTVLSINHAGWAGAPMNTLPAYVESYEHGFPIVEGDLSYTSDGVPVLLHDDTINATARNADGSQISETIRIDEITYEEALQYDFGIYKGEQYAGTKIPTLEQWIEQCKNLGLKMYIDVKIMDTKEQVHAMVDLVKKYGMLSNVTFISNLIAGLQWLVRYEPKARVGYNGNAAFWYNPFTLLTGENAVFMNADNATITDARVETLKEKGLPLEAWVITTSTIDSCSKYISGYTTNDFVAEEYLRNKELS